VLAGGNATQLLVFDGVKMGAHVLVNGVLVGQVANQFLRYVLPLPAAVVGLRIAGNRLEVVFDDAIVLNGRFMACTGGWDWAFYSNTFRDNEPTTGRAATVTRGIWKSVYLVHVPAASVAITHVMPLPRYQGAYPTAPLADDAHGGFVVNVTTHLWAPPGGACGTLSVVGAWGATEVSPPLRLPFGDSAVSVSLHATAQQVRLWWPNGVGPDTRPLYNVTVSWVPAAPVAGVTEAQQGAQTPQGQRRQQQQQALEQQATSVRRIGFRVPALVTGNDTNATWVAGNANADGSDTHGMFLRVNGAAMYARGSNMVPMEEFEGRMDAQAHAVLVQSAAAAGMNTLRVWGGGIFLPDAFYDACDEHGVLLYHDMQFAGNGHMAMFANNASLEVEVRHQVRQVAIFLGFHGTVDSYCPSTSSPSKACRAAVRLMCARVLACV